MEKNEKVFCKYCKYRKGEKGAFCVIKNAFVPRKGFCDKFMPKGGGKNE